MTAACILLESSGHDVRQLSYDSSAVQKPVSRRRGREYLPGQVFFSPSNRHNVTDNVTDNVTLSHFIRPSKKQKADECMLAALVCSLSLGFRVLSHCLVCKIVNLTSTWRQCFKNPCRRYPRSSLQRTQAPDLSQHSPACSVSAS